MLKEIYQLLVCEPNEYKNKKGETATSYDISLLNSAGAVLKMKATKEVFESIKSLDLSEINRGNISVELFPKQLRAISTGGKEYTADIVNVRVTSFEII